MSKHLAIIFFGLIVLSAQTSVFCRLISKVGEPLSQVPKIGDNGITSSDADAIDSIQDGVGDIVSDSNPIETIFNPIAIPIDLLKKLLSIISGSEEGPSSDAPAPEEESTTADATEAPSGPSSDAPAPEEESTTADATEAPSGPSSDAPAPEEESTTADATEAPSGPSSDAPVSNWPEDESNAPKLPVGSNSDAPVSGSSEDNCNDDESDASDLY